ncbi:hypothetical protein PAXRUDRAFT_19653 [Paxillus rubicundulus Ve08.2h10]|uniref:Uncharacterized protein n=1 Tax=Paxillus rubicundulus Ve08.2h10 TaxID=930991 RepID=A0A0D0BT93_9AGAM|nr:hypothetical protein PAXRUDRAFT_19653 [Paxillus rubicundulus Ve08.2h10]
MPLDDQTASTSGTPVDLQQASRPTDQDEEMRSTQPCASTSGAAVDQQHASRPKKRPAKTPSEQPTAKQIKTNFELIHFHVNHLLSLLEDRPKLMQQVVILKQAIDMVYCGGKPKLLEWHLERVKKAMPNDPDISDTMEFLVECVSFSFQFGS